MFARAVACLAVVAVTAAAVGADDYVVLVDDEVEFSTLRTFTVREASTTSRHPALDSPVLRSQLRDAARKALADRGLSESATRPALVVECSLRGVDFAIDRMGRPVEQRGRGARRQPNPNQRRFTEGTLVIDVTRADTRELVWRGVYHDTDDEPADVAAAMPRHATMLLSRFPKQRKP